jgi:hypothetical protein
MERKLTDFQVRCEARLTDALAAVGKSVSNRVLAGQSETYIRGMVGADLTFWIYEDGADFKTPSSHPIFEKPDFDSLDDLAKQFVEKIVKEMK